MFSFIRTDKGIHIENNLFIFNEVDLSNIVVVEKIKRTLTPSKNVRVSEVHGIDGSLFMSSKFGVRKIILDIRIVESNFEDCITQQLNLAMLLFSKTPRALHLRDLGPSGLHNLALLTSEVDLDRKGDTLSGQLEFTCYSPFNYSNTPILYQLGSTPVSVDNKGVETPITLDFTFTSNVTGDISITTNDGQSLILKGPFSAGSNVKYDNYKLRVNGNLMNSKIDISNSTFIKLKTGLTSVSISGLGSNGCTLSFKEAKL